MPVSVNRPPSVLAVGSLYTGTLKVPTHLQSFYSFSVKTVSIIIIIIIIICICIPHANNSLREILFAPVVAVMMREQCIHVTCETHSVLSVAFTEFVSANHSLAALLTMPNQLDKRKASLISRLSTPMRISPVLYDDEQRMWYDYDVTMFVLVIKLPRPTLMSSIVQ